MKNFENTNQSARVSNNQKCQQIDYKRLIQQPLMIKTMQATSPRGRTENILNERDIVNAIDLCPQIMKQDKLFIRNKIKQFFKEYQLSGYQVPPQLTQLLQIFSDCKKPLSKVHLYENHLHLLQVKLRKYIGNERKRYKQQCLHQFKKDKGFQQTRRANMMQRKIRNDDFHQHNNWVIGVPDSQLSKHYSQQHQKGSPTHVFNQAKRTNRSTRNKNLSGNISPVYEQHPKYFQAQSCRNSNSNHLKPNWDNYFPYKPSRSNSRQQLHRQTKHQAQEYIFPTRINKQNQPISNTSQIQSSMIINQMTQNQQFPYFCVPQDNFEAQYLRQKKIDRSNQKKFDQIEIKGHYKGNGFQQTNKARNKQFNSIQNIEQQHYIPKNNLDNKTSKLSNPLAKQDLFTPPQLLQECRRLIKHSQYEHEKIKNLMQKSKKDQFSDTKVFGQIQCTQYDSPKFSHRSKQPTRLPRFCSLKQLILHIFKKDWKVFLSAEQRQQIIERSPAGLQNQVQYLVNKTNPKTNFISFLDLASAIKTCSDINFSLSNIFQLFDVDAKGFIRPSDFQVFLQNFTDCPIQYSILEELKGKLLKFEKIVQRVFKTTEIVPGCFEYLQLIQNPQIFQLCEILQLFEFEIDTASSGTFTNDILQ